MIDISVIIPLYNAESYLDKCIKSILYQKYVEIEVIVVDDGSTDRSLEYIRIYTLEDDRIKVITQDNQDAGTARNNALKVASGEYIHFLDADDWILPELYMNSYKVAKETKSDIVMFNYQTYNNTTGAISEVRLFDELLSGEDVATYQFSQKQRFFMNAPVMPWNKLYRRGFLEETGITFDSLKCANDRSFYYKTVMAAKDITILPRTFITYRIGNDKSLVGKNRLDHFDCHFKAYESIASYSENEKWKLRVLLLDIALDDIFYFYEKADAQIQYRILGQIKEFLQQQHRLNARLLKASKFRKRIKYILELDLEKLEVIDLEGVNHIFTHSQMKNRPSKQLENILDTYKEYGCRYTLRKIINKIR